MRVTYGNLKGGVGKSTSSVYTALGLAAAGGRVLLVDADATSLTLALAGKFEPTPDMYELANRSSTLTSELFAIIRDVLRAGVEVHDLSLVLEMMAAIKIGSPERTRELRRRYLALALDGLRAREREELPGPAPAWQELSERWSAH